MPVTPRSAPPPRWPGLAPLAATALLSGVVASAATVALVRGIGPGSPDADLGTATFGSPAASAAPVPTTVAVPDPDTAARRLDGLETALEAARAERSRLAATLLGLSREMGELTDAVGAVNLPVAGGAGVSGSADPEASPSGGGPDAGGGRRGGGPRADPIDALVAAGLDPASAAELTRRQDEYRLARLELVDQAAREGWDDSDELEARLDALDDTRPALRDELGEDGYDRYLHDAGSPNRVGVESVIPGSAAATAGLRTGDIVFGYAGGRVFAPNDLQGVTREGVRGETITLEAERDGRRITVQVPRGPLGITLDRLRREP